MLHVLKVTALAFVLISCTAVVPAPKATPTECAIKHILIRASIAQYGGPCPCPDYVDQAGRRCGKRSAYSRPGGAAPLCYPRDVSADRVAAYRTRTAP